MADEQGIVIVGTPRSGTTLLRRILDAHSRLSSPPETYLLSAAARFLHEEQFAQGLRIGALFGLGYAGFDESEVLDRLRAFTFEFFEAHTRKHGKARWVEKTAFDAFHLAKIRRLCQGHVHFICMKRHGLDVAVSIRDLVDKTGGYVEELHEYLKREPEPLVAFARAWVDTASAVAELAAEDPAAIEISYEELTSDTEATVRRVLDHIGEPWEDGLIDKALGETGQVGFGDWKTYARKQVDASSVGRWKSLPQGTIERLGHACNDTLVALGYDEVAIGGDEGSEPGADEDPEEARRRYELGLLLNRMKSD